MGGQTTLNTENGDIRKTETNTGCWHSKLEDFYGRLCGVPVCDFLCVGEEQGRAVYKAARKGIWKKKLNRL